MTQLKKNLESLSFGELLQVKEKVGAKTFHSLVRKKNPLSQDSEEEPSSSSSEEESSHEESRKGAEKRASRKPAKRANKNMPMEMSSKRPVTRNRNVTEGLSTKLKHRDPRFEPLAGKLNPELYKTSYGFIREYQDSEVSLLKKDIASEKDRDRKQQLQLTLNSLVSRINARQQKESVQEKKREWKKKEASLVKEGKKPFFLKTAEMKKQMLHEKYKSLGKGVSMEKFLEKRRKRNSQKEHVKMPSTRRSQ
ncbi:rRNA biogenesis protein rrp36 [Kappamyces sp. JEL0829]|nr:rRNA biogenesis protein rrp36 [Kappamyces sp. JEL0829]